MAFEEKESFSKQQKSEIAPTRTMILFCAPILPITGGILLDGTYNIEK